MDTGLRSEFIQKTILRYMFNLAAILSQINDFVLVLMRFPVFLFDFDLPSKIKGRFFDVFRLLLKQMQIIQAQTMKAT